MTTAITSRAFELADPDAVFDFYYRQGWTDGLPIVPPTEDKILATLAALGLGPEEIIAVVAPRMAPATAEKVAINMVMAGCLPAYAPVVAAGVAAVCAPTFNLHGIQTTTNPVAPLLLVNGPIRNRVELNCGRNALGPGRRANAAIGLDNQNSFALSVEESHPTDGSERGGPIGSYRLRYGLKF